MGVNCASIRMHVGNGLRGHMRPSAARRFHGTQREKGCVCHLFSMLLNPRSCTDADENERLSIAMTTGPASVEPPCMRAPTERKRPFRQVLADYERPKATPRQLPPLRSIARLYMFLTADDVNAFIGER